MEEQYGHNHLANPAVLTVRPNSPGKPISAVKKEFGLSRVVKLASNENLAGPSPLALKALNGALSDLHCYPDDAGIELKEALAQKHDLEVDQIILGHGATDIIDIVVRAFVCPGDQIISAHPGFPWFQMLGQLSGGRNVIVPLRNHTHDLGAMLKSVTPQTKLILVANPNNPTGTFVGRRKVDRFLRAVLGHAIVVLDESYIDYVTDEPIAPSNGSTRGGVITVRTFSKISGLAGLRLGYAIAEPGIIQLLERARQPFNTTTLAHVAAMASLDDAEHIERSRQMVIQGREFLYTQFDQLGIDYVRTQANFIFVNFHRDSWLVFERLQQLGYIIRPVLEHWSRITIGTPEQNAGLIDALDQVLSETSEPERREQPL